MTAWLALLVAALGASGTWLMLRRGVLRRVLGIMLLGHAVNLLVFCMTGGTRRAAPLLREGGEASTSALQDPLPQALVLTAIVIGFALQAFVLALVAGDRRDAPRSGNAP